MLQPYCSMKRCWGSPSAMKMELTAPVAVSANIMPVSYTHLAKNVLVIAGMLTPDMRYEEGYDLAQQRVARLAQHAPHIGIGIELSLIHI